MDQAEKMIVELHNLIYQVLMFVTVFGLFLVVTMVIYIVWSAWHKAKMERELKELRKMFWNRRN